VNRVEIYSRETITPEQQKENEENITHKLCPLHAAELYCLKKKVFTQWNVFAKKAIRVEFKPL
jgi:thiamine kinase-like enzyme